MNKYRVTFNFSTGYYDVLRLEDMSVLSSFPDYKEAQAEMDRLSHNQPNNNPTPA